jgi:hypothetical protein
VSVKPVLWMMICKLCGRPLGAKTEAHHLIPKTFGGKETVSLHPICHRKIHTTFSERELQSRLNTIEALQDHDEIKIYIAWISKKDPDFYVATSDTRERRIKRRR